MTNYSNRWWREVILLTMALQNPSLIEPFVEQLEIVHEKDQSEMVLIPAGAFLFGSREDDKEAGQDEKPQRSIELPAYYMDKYPVTNRQYCLFLNEVQPGAKELEKWIDLTGSWQQGKCRIRKEGKGYQIETGFEKNPVIFVTWYEATEYAKWVGKQLPTEQQWEKAARGTHCQHSGWSGATRGSLCWKSLSTTG